MRGVGAYQPGTTSLRSLHDGCEGTGGEHATDAIAPYWAFLEGPVRLEANTRSADQACRPPPVLVRAPPGVECRRPEHYRRNPARLHPVPRSARRPSAVSRVRCSHCREPTFVDVAARSF